MFSTFSSPGLPYVGKAAPSQLEDKPSLSESWRRAPIKALDLHQHNLCVLQVWPASMCRLLFNIDRNGNGNIEPGLPRTMEEPGRHCSKTKHHWLVS